MSFGQHTLQGCLDNSRFFSRIGMQIYSALVAIEQRILNLYSPSSVLKSLPGMVGFDHLDITLMQLLLGITKVPGQREIAGTDSIANTTLDAVSDIEIWQVLKLLCFDVPEKALRQ
jgi:hypothetical protein